MADTRPPTDPAMLRRIASALREVVDSDAALLGASALEAAAARIAADASAVSLLRSAVGYVWPTDRDLADEIDAFLSSTPVPEPTEGGEDDEYEIDPDCCNDPQSCLAACMNRDGSPWRPPPEPAAADRGGDPR